MSRSNFKAIFLGTGTSQGVPVITCKCPVCLSTNLKDKRLRTSLLLEINNQYIVIDTGPDFRQQMLNVDIPKLDAVLYTHEHKDHIAGMDDIRAFNYKQKGAIDMYGSHRVLTGLKKEFHYVFSDYQYPGIPQVNFNLIDKMPFYIGNEEVIPIEVMHYQLPVTGFRIKNFTYITDANYIAPDEFKKIEGTEFLVINALRKEKHISHFNLSEALDLIEVIQPKKAFLTHISHLMGKHEDVSCLLPENVFIAHDDLVVDLDANYGV
jgi:phosphoribosyl 1,2-cyclic phosphate phosphodiesterase